MDASWLLRLGKGDAEEESRSADTPRTLVHRKAKDEDLREPARLRLLVDDQGGAVVDVDPVQPVAQVKRGRPRRLDPREATEVLVLALDQASIPIELGEGPVKEWIEINLPGQNIPRAVVRSAIAIRRATREATETVAQLPDLEPHKPIEPEHPCPRCGGVTATGPDGRRACVAPGRCRWQEKAS